MATGSFFHPPNRHRIDSLETARLKAAGRIGWEGVPPTPAQKASSFSFHFASSPAAKHVHEILSKNIQDFGPQRHYLRGQSALRPTSRW